MKRYIFIVLTIILSFIPVLSNAQYYKFKPYGFVQVQDGISTVFTNVKLGDRISSATMLGIGYQAIPELGLRVNLTGWESKGGFGSTGESYKHNFADTDFDLLFNITNIVGGYSETRKFDLNLIAGIGMNYAWNGTIGNTHYATAKENTSNKWGNGLKQTSFFGTQFRMGLSADWKLCKHFALGFEADMNTIGDDFNAKCSQSNDWMLTAQLSLTYKFWGKGKKKQVAEPVEPIQEIAEAVTEEQQMPAEQEVTEAAPIVEEAVPETAPEPQPTPLYEVNNYSIRCFAPIQVATVEKVKEWCKANPEKKIVIEGYADKGTGTAAYNKRISQRRAYAFAEELKKKGVPASQITTKSFGDTIQPFAENDANRCVIIKEL